MEKAIARFGICFQFVSIHDFSHLLVNQTSTWNESNMSSPTSSLVNTTTTDLVNSRTLTINTIFMIIMATFVIIPNTMLILGIVKTSKPSITLSKGLYIYVSFVDLSYGVLTNPYFLILSYTHKTCTNQSVGMAFSTVSVGLGISTFVLISIIRNQRIRKPLSEIKYHLVWGYLIAFIVIFIGYGVLTLWVFSDLFTSHALLATYWMFMFVFFFVETLLMIVFNTWTKITLHCSNTTNNISHSKEKKIDKEKEHKNNTIDSQKNIDKYKDRHGTKHVKSNLSEEDSMRLVVEQRNKRAVVTLLWLSAVYVVCILPVAVYYLWLYTTLLDFYQNPMKVIIAYSRYPVVHSLLPLCSGLNAIVYLAKSPEIKRYYKKIFLGTTRRIQPKTTEVLNGEDSNNNNKEQNKVSSGISCTECTVITDD